MMSPLRLEELVERQMVSPEAAAVLTEGVQVSRWSIRFVGRPGTGKTTLLRAVIQAAMGLEVSATCYDELGEL